MPTQQEQNVKMAAKRKRRIAAAKGSLQQQEKNREARQGSKANTGMQAFEVLGQYVTGARAGVPKIRRGRSGS